MIIIIINCGAKTSTGALLKNLQQHVSDSKCFLRKTIVRLRKKSLHYTDIQITVKSECPPPYKRQDQRHQEPEFIDITRRLKRYLFRAGLPTVFLLSCRQNLFSAFSQNYNKKIALLYSINC
jgi:hypothetical protein